MINVSFSGSDAQALVSARITARIDADLNLVSGVVLMMVIDDGETKLRDFKALFAAQITHAKLGEKSLERMFTAAGKVYREHGTTLANKIARQNDRTIEGIDAFIFGYVFGELRASGKSRTGEYNSVTDIFNQHAKPKAEQTDEAKAEAWLVRAEKALGGEIALDVSQLARLQKAMATAQARLELMAAMIEAEAKARAEAEAAAEAERAAA